MSDFKGKDLLGLEETLRSLNVAVKRANTVYESIHPQTLNNPFENIFAVAPEFPPRKTRKSRVDYEMAEAIINEFGSACTSTYAFGGYVRDCLLSQPFNDIDMYVPYGQSITDLVRHLNIKSSRFAYTIVALDVSPTTYIKKPTFKVKKSVLNVVDKATNVTMDVELIQSQDPANDHPYTNLDIDINCLARGGAVGMQKLFSPIPEYKHLVNQTIDKIRSKKFTILNNNIHPNRSTNLILKGFSPTKEALLSVSESTEMKDQYKGAVPYFEKAEAAQSKAKPKFMEVLAKDAEKGAYRSGANQGVKALKAGLSKILEHEGMNDEKTSAIMEFFDTKIGEMMLRTGLGYGLMYLPVEAIQENKYAKGLSEELRVSGLAEGMDYGAELASKFLIPALMEAYKNTPLLENIPGLAPEKVRLDSLPSEAKAPAQVQDYEVDVDVFNEVQERKVVK